MNKGNVKSRKWQLKSLGVATLLAFNIFLFTATAQESINATGKDALGSGGSVSYSVGQVIYTTNSGTTGSVAQGVQQPFILATGIDEAKGITLSAYPNPTTDYLTLEVKDFDLSALHFQLYDMQGKLLQREKITSNQTRIALSNLVPATYFVKVTESSKELKTFKIIKN